MRKRMPKNYNLIGEKIGILSVVSRAHKTRYGQYYTCVCDCGKIKCIRGHFLYKKRVKSCGCQQGKYEHKIRHGMCDTRLYRIWKGVSQRCRDKNISAYARYGGRGITICKKWASPHGFVGFMNDMHEGYLGHCAEFGEKNTWLLRRDTNGNYDKKNCFWGKPEKAYEGSYMRIENKIIADVDGTDISIADFIKKYNISRTTFNRGVRMGKTIEEIAYTNISRVKNYPVYLKMKEIYNKNKKNVDRLKQRERQVLQLRFDGAGKSLRNVGYGLDLSGERIRQIEKKAFEKLIKI